MSQEIAVQARSIIRQLLQEHQHRAGALLPVLHAIQDATGHIPTDSVPDIAHALNLSAAEVHGVLSYYHHFRSKAPNRHLIKICRAEACQAMGSEALWSHACTKFSSRKGPGVTLESVYCLGLCATAPALLIDEQPHGRMEPEKFDRLMNALMEGS